MKPQRFGLIESSARGASLARGDCAEEYLAEFPELRGANAIHFGEGIEVARAALGHVGRRRDSPNRHAIKHFHGRAQ
ncbi:hypothetical protein MESS2_1370001 [Mesorhizobium metallidurans STM 2683]|uniref:Uncharacterized protein n=1 Tax=Mesorhizobium metallidurans STM 2683 TaxID=1297569 RepID=M5EJ22_9HYPH|nr:hypothetical protein MESS2_1370001 [Mesorhizobium metallidurans STM 2683]